MNRRDFIKNTCISCIAVGAGIDMLLLQGCTSMPIVKINNNKGYIEVNEVVFANNATTLILRDEKLPYDLLLVKQGAGKYKALLMQCTHRDYALTANSEGLYCASHGSRFNLEGEVIEGPAIAALKNYPLEVKSGKILIKVL